MHRGYLPALLALTLAACESDDRPPTPSPGGGTGETITGRERIGWDQSAGSQAELATLRFAIYVDGNRSEMSGVTCTPTAGPSGFSCSGQLPSMTPGSHVLELAVFTTIGDIVESPRSAPLRVTVSATTLPSVSNPLQHGERIMTQDGVELQAALVAEALHDVSDVALTADGRLLIAERAGAIVIHDAIEGQQFRTLASDGDGGILALALSPDFSSSGHLFVVQSGSGTSRLVRYRLLERRLIERVTLLPDIAAPSNPTAALRFGPDGKLYAAFDAGASRDTAENLADWRGKILRLNADGSTPDDQPAASPVFWSGLSRPRGMDWITDTGPMWIVERGADNVERLRAITTIGARPRRAGQRATYVLPGTVGASSIASFRSRAIVPFDGNLFVAASEGGYLLRVQFDEQDRLRAVLTEKLLEGRLGEVRAVTCSPHGALYVATQDRVWRLLPR